MTPFSLAQFRVEPLVGQMGIRTCNIVASACNVDNVIYKDGFINNQ
jgi:hypothetical protein